MIATCSLYKSSPTETLFGKALTASFTKDLSVIADVPIITLCTPISNHFSISYSVLIPPPNCTLHFVFWIIFFIESSFLFFPANAPSKSTT